MNCKKSAARAPSQATGSESLEQHFARLQGANWSARELSRRLPLLLRLGIDPDRRAPWMSGLREAWRRGGWAMTPASCRRLVELAAIWRDWALVREVGQTIGENLDGHGALLLVDSLRFFGEIDCALDVAVRWQLASPHDRRHADAYRSLLDELRFFKRFPAIDGSNWGEPDLRLVPLSHHHLEEFAWQYRDPEISELCCLPRFGGDDDWLDWLDGLYAEGDELPLAVLHRDYGFIGCSHLVLREGLGFLYYWLGREFRGQGLGFRANRLLLRAALECFGMRACYAKVFEYNAPSRSLLEKLGFENTAIRALPPDQDEIFYRIGECGQPHRIAEELIEFLALMKSDTMVAAPLSVEILQ